MGEWLRTVTRLRPVLLIAAAAFLVASQPGQIVELYAIDAESLAAIAAEGMHASFLDPGLWLAAAKIFGPMLIALAFLCAVLWLGSIYLVALGREPGRETPLEVAFIVAVAITPAVGLVLGIFNAARQAQELQQASLAASLSNYAVAVAAVLVLVSSVLVALSLRYFDGLSRFAGRCLTRAGCASALILFVVIAAGVIFLDDWSPARLGVLALLFLFLGLLAFLLVYFSTLYHRDGFPATMIALAAALTISYFGLNDNHEVGAKLLRDPAPELEASFAQWGKARADADHYGAKPYPVYIVAAEGGGLYAGYHVASALAKLQDACPNFAQHAFAISSVSGGSLGAAVFAAAAKTLTRNAPWHDCTAVTDGPMQQVVKRYFSKDFLSPLVAARLFPDTIQRFMPVPIKALDPSRALEKSFERAWGDVGADASQGNVFSQPLDALWSPEGSVPALLLNATSVATGARVTLSALAFDATPTALHVSQAFCIGNDYFPTLQIPLSAAVSLSARFPWVTPTGWIRRDPSWNTAEPQVVCRKPQVQRGDRLYLGDGGYFENSGLETALDVAARLRKIAATDRAAFPNGADIRIIMVFANDDFLLRWNDADSDLLEQGSDELVEPVKALLMTRIARTRAVHSRAIAFDDANFQSGGYFDCKGKYLLDKSALRRGSDDVHQIMLDARALALPIGWRLSSRAVQSIEAQSTAESLAATRMIEAELRGMDTEALKVRMPPCDKAQASDPPR